jgi:predicted RNA-binding Zn-ribbon protein involved in translation (DUF1610 family)
MFCESCHTYSQTSEFIKADSCPKCGYEISVIDAVARTYANFYLANPNINCDSQQNRDFQSCLSICQEEINLQINFTSSGCYGSGNWWKDLYERLNKKPPQELKQYLDFMDW